MSAKSSLKIASLAFLAFMAAGAARAEGGGGGGGGGGGSGGNDRLREAEQSYARGNAMIRLRLLRGLGDYAESTLPDGTRIRSTGIGGGDRIVTTRTPDGLVTGGFRPKGQKADKKGASSRTVYNPRTGITSTFTRYADGSTIGVHVDAQGNRSTSTSMTRAAP
jgi:hypothetical protein